MGRRALKRPKALLQSLVELGRRDWGRARILPWLLRALRRIWRYIASGADEAPHLARSNDSSANSEQSDEKQTAFTSKPSIGSYYARLFAFLQSQDHPKDRRKRPWMKKLKRNLAQLKENVLAAVALALFLSIGVGSVTVLSGHWQIPRLWQAAANYIINLVADRLHKNLSYDAIAIFFSAFLLRLLPRLMELIKAVATVVVNLMSMCFSVVAAISFGWMDEDGQVPFAVQWFLIAADKRDSADLLADLEDLYPTWVKQRGPIKAAWLCYARLFSYYGHRLIAKLSAPRRRSAR